MSARVSCLLLACCLGPLITGCGGDDPPVIEPAATSEESSAPSRAPLSATASDPRPTSESTSSDRPPTKTDPLPNTSTPAAENVSAPVAPVFRPSDSRPQHDDQQLAQRGIFNYESKHLKLYTDIDPAIARTLPALIDQAYPAWEEYFGPLPPDRERKAFRITGYLIADMQRFEQAGLVPVDLQKFLNGRHRGAQFWMIDQKWGYYRRHLLIHEATHCFMTFMPDTRLPFWYLEGMAEHFGTHRTDNDGKLSFRVMPDDSARFEGLSRIEFIQRERARTGPRPLGRPRAEGERLPRVSGAALHPVLQLEPDDFIQTESYAWSWALCKFFDTHPRYRDAFRKLGRTMTGRQFDRAFGEFWSKYRDAARFEWKSFVTDLDYGTDIPRAAIDFRSGKPLPDSGRPATVVVQTDRGWQSSGVSLGKGETCRITATGRFELAQTPKPWISEPRGISFQYFNGKPIGLLLATFRAADPLDEQDGVLDIQRIGRAATFTARVPGTLYFRVNDFPGRLADNRGEVRVEMRTQSSPGGSPPLRVE